MLQKCYGHERLSRSLDLKWYKSLGEDRDAVENEARSGPSTPTTDKKSTKLSLYFLIIS